MKKTMKDILAVIKALSVALDCDKRTAKYIYDNRPNDNIFDIIEYGRNALLPNCVFWDEDNKRFILAPKQSSSIQDYIYKTDDPVIVKFFEENQELSVITINNDKTEREESGSLILDSICPSCGAVCGTNEDTQVLQCFTCGFILKSNNEDASPEKSCKTCKHFWEYIDCPDIWGCSLTGKSKPKLEDEGCRWEKK